MYKFDTSKAVPIHNLKKDTGFYLCYKHNGITKSLVRCWYGKKSDFFFYPILENYNCELRSKDGTVNPISKDAESRHERITIHKSGVIVGPDKHERATGHKYDKMKTPLKDCKDGVRLAIHQLGGPGIYKDFVEKSKNKGNWVEFIPKGSNISPVVAIDAYPIHSDDDLNRVKVLKNYFCGFMTKYFEQNYRILILFELQEEELTSQMDTHTVLIPIET